MTAYETVHSRLKDQRGRAKEHLCVACGKQALDWALQYHHRERIIWNRPKPYSKDLDDYAPMCRSCHISLDLAAGVRDQELRDEGQRRNLVIARAAFQKRCGVDEDYRNRIAGIRSGNAAVARKSLLPRRCGGCDMVTFPGALGKHQKSTGHTGWEPA